MTALLLSGLVQEQGLLSFKKRVLDNYQLV